MHKLVRRVRFSVNPFLPKDSEGFNSYGSKPAGEGLAIFFELTVALAGAAGADTGFVVNVVDIDKCVRREVVPVLAERVREDYRKGGHIGLGRIAEFLQLARQRLAGKFGEAILSDLSLALNPFRKVAMDCEDVKMIYFSEKFEFAAMHKLWNDEFSEEHNFEVFGKCANPAGHGHNYIVEVTVKMAAGAEGFGIGDFEKTVDEGVINVLDHKNLNADVAWFAETNPTMENITVFAWEAVVGKFSHAKLHCVTVWETDKTYCTYYG